MSDETKNKNSDGGDDGGSSNNNSTSTSPQVNVVGNLIEHVKANKIDVALWATRMLTILFTIGYIIPIFGSSQSAYNKVLLANAATSALRLHQRLPAFQLSREFLSRLLVEDSCHYLLFSLIFIYVSPILLILLPVVLFAILHASSYSIKLLDILGRNSWWLARFLISIVEFQTTNILRLSAFAEIFIMPLSIILVFTGKAGLMTIFTYYQFLSMRYMSRRNPFTKNMFTELRMAIEALAVRSPPIVAKVLYGGISVVKRLAPQQAPAQ